MSDTVSSAVGIKHCGDPEEWPKNSSEESAWDGMVTSPADEPYITAGVGVVEGVTDVVSTSKLASVCGES